MTTIEMAPLLREDLTKRERVVLAHLTEETTLDDIARRLFVTRNTVKSQVRSAYRKLGVSTRAEAVDRARELGLQ
jgi:LuxR family transcriptional regulator of spore coat protein|nr:LuxR C-terminal-related transcriptional regulator [Flavimobilis marinus]